MQKKSITIMKIALIITTGRTGSDFLQHCLDGVNGLIVFSDKFDYHQFFSNFIGV